MFNLFKIITLLFIIFSSELPAENRTESSAEFLNGVDLSFQPEIEHTKIQYKDENGNSIELLPFLRKKGVNSVRMRLWYEPQNSHCDLAEVKAYARKIKVNGMKFLLDIQYSDSWADPSNQTVPKKWKNLNFSVLRESVFIYTKRVISELKFQGTTPDIVQIGNETNNGFLWNYGKIGGKFDGNSDNYFTLVSQAIRAVRSVDKKIEIMLHLAGFSDANQFFQNAVNHKIDFDIIGISYYSIWHGTSLETLQTALDSLAAEFPQQIMVVETAYPWTLSWNDKTQNIYGEETQLIKDFPATPRGQKKYLQALKTMLKNLKNDKGLGFCYWSPDWIAFKGKNAENGSAWENATIFDFNCRVLPVIEIFGE